MPPAEPTPPRGAEHARGGLYARAIAAFLPAGVRLGDEAQERASLVAGVAVTIAVILTPFVLISWGIYGGPNVTSLSALGVIATMLGIGVFQRRTGRVAIAGALVPAVLLIVLTAVGFRRGGLGAVNLICYPFVPLVAGFLVGRRGAIAAASGVTAVMLGFWVLHGADHPFPAGYSGDQRHLIAAVGTVLMSALVMGITLLYEDARWKARRIAAESLAELRRRGVELEEARERAEAAARTKGDFLARVSHELRTPLNGVLGMTELLLGSGLDAQQRDFARDSRRSARALLALVNDLLDFSKLEAGHTELTRRGFDPRGPAEDAVGVLSGVAQRKGLELVCAVAPDVPRWILGDPDRVRQVLLNLVGNGVKYTESGRVLLRVRTHDGGAALCFEVDDTGIGLPTGPTSQLFEPFSQADPQSNLRLGGVGLGLAICRELVRRMGGRINAQPLPPGGSRFFFTLPVHAPPEPAPSPPTLPLSGRTGIVVDDDPAAGESAADLLRAQGMTCRAFVTVDAAVQALRDAPVDLVVADSVMPDRDGIALVRTASDDPGLRSIPVLLSVPYGRSLDLSGIARVRTGRVRRPVFERPLLEAAAALLELPPPAAEAIPAVEESATDVPTMDGGGAQVLVVDDNAVGRRLARELLTRLGFAVDEAADGAQAVEKALATSYAVILMDCRMPEVDGYEATRIIRQRQEGIRTPIVAVTAHALDEERERCLAAGMDDYLTKPFRPADLAKVVFSWTRRGST